MKALLLALLIAAPAAATPILDQNNPPTLNPGVGLSADMSTDLWQQEVVAGMSGHLVGVEYFIPENGYGADSRHNFGIILGEAWQWGENQFDSIQTVNFPADFLDSKYVDVSSANIILEEGDVFSLRWSGVAYGVGTSLVGSGGTGSYEAGDLWVRFAHGGRLPTGRTDVDIAFRTYMELVSGVPEPGSVLMLMIGLLPITFGLRLTR